MKFRLNADHYICDMILPEGTEIGDETTVPFRYSDGSAMPPSREMIALDDEAKKMIAKHFPEGKPPADPTKPIPLQGTFSEAKVPAKVPTPQVPPLTAAPPPPKPKE